MKLWLFIITSKQVPDFTYCDLYPRNTIQPYLLVNILLTFSNKFVNFAYRCFDGRQINVNTVKWLILEIAGLIDNHDIECL